MTVSEGSPLAPGSTNWIPQAAAKVRNALAQLEAGNSAEVKPVGQGVSERRIHWGQGLRIYFGQDGQTILILLGGGTKADLTGSFGTKLIGVYFN